MSDTRRYPAQVFWSDEDEGYIAVATDLPGCSAFGDSQEEALRELQDAIAAWIDAQRAAGNEIPKPSSPAREFSGRVLVRMPRSLHASLSHAATAEGVSLNQLIVYRLSITGSLETIFVKSSAAPADSFRFTRQARGTAQTGFSFWMTDVHAHEEDLDWLKFPISRVKDEFAAKTLLFVNTTDLSGMSKRKTSGR